VKAIPKKHLDHIRRSLSLKPPHTSIIKYRVIWYSASLLLYGWFLSWIAYEIFVWHKPITQVNMANFAGAITAMALIWAGTKLFKTPRHVAQPPTPKQENIRHKEHEPTKKEKEPKKRKQQQPQPQPEPEEQQKQPEPQQPEYTTPSTPGCTHNLSYLHQPGKTKEIPDECLTCTQLIQCLTTTNK